MNKGIVGGLIFLIGLGLVLRFGKSSQALVSSGFSGVNTMISNLSLDKWPGNTPY